MYFGPVGSLCHDVENTIGRLLSELDRNLKTNYAELTREEIQHFTGLNEAVQGMLNGFQKIHRKMEGLRAVVENRQRTEPRASNTGTFTSKGWTSGQSAAPKPMSEPNGWSSKK